MMFSKMESLKVKESFAKHVAVRMSIKMECLELRDSFAKYVAFRMSAMMECPVSFVHAAKNAAKIEMPKGKKIVCHARMSANWECIQVRESFADHVAAKMSAKINCPRVRFQRGWFLGFFSH